MARTRSKPVRSTSSRMLRAASAPAGRPTGILRRSAARKSVPVVVVQSYVPSVQAQSSSPLVQARSSSPSVQTRSSSPSVQAQTPTPSRPRTPRPQKGALRDIPCAGCLSSALAGKSNGDCYDATGRGSRCWKCSSGHKCEALPPSCIPVALQFLSELPNAQYTRLSKLRSAVKVMLEISKDNGEVGGHTVPEAVPHGEVEGNDLEEWRMRIKDAFGSLVDVILERFS